MPISGLSKRLAGFWGEGVEKELSGGVACETFATTFSYEVTVRRGTATCFSNAQFPITGEWADYAIPVSAVETSAGLGGFSISFTTSGASTVLLDDVSFRKDGGDPTNTKEFRDEVVASLRGVRPGILRYVNWQDLGDSLDNVLAPAFGRKCSGYLATGTSENNMMPGLHEFLVLCAHIGADPWYSIPVTFCVSCSIWCKVPRVLFRFPFMR